MPYKLHIQNLDLSTQDADLQELFSRHGAVRSAQVMPFRSLGAPSISGIVEMESEDQGATAIARLNGQEYRGRPLSVDWATDLDSAETFDSAGADATADPDPVRGPRPGDFGDRRG